MDLLVWLLFAALACAVLGERAGTSLAEGLSLLLGILLQKAVDWLTIIPKLVQLNGIWVLTISWKMGSHIL